MEKYFDTKKRIKSLRREQNKTQQQLCTYMDRTIQTISAIENGKQPYTTETAKKIASFFGVDYRYLTYDLNTKTWEEQFNYIDDVMEKRKTAIFFLLNSYGYEIKASDSLFFQNGYIKKTDIDKINVNSDVFSFEEVYTITTPDGTQKMIHESTLINLFDDTIYLLNSRLQNIEKLK